VSEKRSSALFNDEIELLKGALVRMGAPEPHRWSVAIVLWLHENDYLIIANPPQPVNQSGDAAAS
jgi:hypothetical protein